MLALKLKWGKNPEKERTSKESPDEVLFPFDGWKRGLYGVGWRLRNTGTKASLGVWEVGGEEGGGRREGLATPKEAKKGQIPERQRSCACIIMIWLVTDTQGERDEESGDGVLFRFCQSKSKLV